MIIVAKYYPDIKVHGANMGTNWVMLAPWTLLSGLVSTDCLKSNGNLMPLCDDADIRTDASRKHKKLNIPDNSVKMLYMFVTYITSAPVGALVSLLSLNTRKLHRSKLK